MPRRPKAPIDPSRITYVGAAIKYMRELRGMTQDELADRAGGTWVQTQISQIENKEGGNPSYGRVKQLADALNTTVAHLYSLIEANGDDPPPARDAIDEVRRDIAGFADQRPELLRDLRKIRDTYPPEVYRRTIERIHKMIAFGIQTELERFEDADPSRSVS